MEELIREQARKFVDAYLGAVDDDSEYAPTLCRTLHTRLVCRSLKKLGKSSSVRNFAFETDVMAQWGDDNYDFSIFKKQIFLSQSAGDLYLEKKNEFFTNCCYFYFVFIHFSIWMRQGHGFVIGGCIV